MGFYEQNDGRKRVFDVDVKPPRLVLREEEHTIDGARGLSEGHLDFKVWLQHKIEESSMGRVSPRFLSSEERDDERVIAMREWSSLSGKFLTLLEDGIFGSEGIRESRQLTLMEKLISLSEDYGSGDLERIVRETGGKLNPGTIENQSWIEWKDQREREDYKIKMMICRELVREMISKCKTSSLETEDFHISIPSLTLMTGLSERIDRIVSDGIAEVEEFYNDAAEGNFTVLGALKDSEIEDWNRLLEDGFGSPRGRDKKGLSREERTTLNCRKLAYNIVVAIHDEGYLSKGVMDQEMYRLHFQDGDESKDRDRGLKRYPNTLFFTYRLMGAIGRSGREDFREGREHAIYRWLRGSRDRWMYSPPWPHGRSDPPLGDFDKGGLLVETIRRVVSNHQHYEQFDMDGEVMSRCEPDDAIRSAMNALQDVQWEINLDFLTALFDVKLADGSILPAKNTMDCIDVKSSTIVSIGPKGEFRSSFEDSVMERTDYDGEEEDYEVERQGKVGSDRKLVLEWVKRIIDHNANVFWHSWVCDFRGRLMPRCAKLSPQGDDLDRALIRFKQWKPLGRSKEDKTGANWIHMQIHSLMEGVKSGLWKKEGHTEDCHCCSPARKNSKYSDRLEWVDCNLENLRKIGRQPSEYTEELGLNLYRPGKSEAYQRAAALIELERIHEEYEACGCDWTKVLSGLPVRLDATCNGFQHVSALIRDRDLGRLVNVIGTEEEGPRDLYSKVSENAMENYGQKGGNLWNLLRGVLEEREVKEAIERIFSRAVAKKPTMTRAYGSKDTVKHFDGRGGTGKPRYVQVPKTDEEIEDAAIEIKEIDEGFQELFWKWEKTAPKQWLDYEDTEDPDSRKERLARRRELWGDLNEYCNDLPGSKMDKWIKALRHTRAVRVWEYGSALHNELILPGRGLSRKLAVPNREYYRGFWYEVKGRFNHHDDEFVNHWEVTDTDGCRLGRGSRRGRSGRFECEKDAIAFIEDKPGNKPISPDEVYRRSRLQHEITKLVNKAITGAIKDVTYDSFDFVEKKLIAKAKKTPMYWPGVSWKLPQEGDEGGRDSCVVNHYYISAFVESTSRWMNPCNRGGVYNGTLPKWYTFDNKPFKKEELRKSREWGLGSNYKSKHRILKKFISHQWDEKEGAWDSRLRDKDKKWLEEMKGDPEPTKRGSLQKRGSCSGKFREMLEEMSESDEDVREMLRLWRHWDSSLIRYDHRSEERRIEPRKARRKFVSALPPNFIHSIDAYHMRRVINRLRTILPNLSFWPVHDAFGTHACDVEIMREVVREEFHDLHEEIHEWVISETWIGKKATNREELELSEILESGYLIS